MDQQTTKSNEQDTQSPLDSIISRVDSYIKNPKLATPQTLTALKGELEDLKSVFDSEGQDDSGDMQDTVPDSGQDKPGLAIMIGMGRKGGVK